MQHLDDDEINFTNTDAMHEHEFKRQKIKLNVLSIRKYVELVQNA